MAPRLAAKMVVKPKKRSAQDESDARKPKKPTVTTVKPRITASKSTGTAGNPTVIAGDATVTRIKTEDLMMISTAFQHENTQAILDVFDEFRKRGIDDEVSLPCVVVGGDTSSGKSSVMERLTGIAFPSGEDVVTRFATEVAMRPADVLQVLVTIIPGDGRNATERLNLRRFVKKLNSIAEYPDAHAEAAKVMGLTTKKTAIVGDPLRVDIRGPGITPLTLVDLPGLIHATTATTTEADKKLSSTLLHRYLNNPRTIILCVVSAINDFVMQEITSLARKVDPEGKRTMGLITKPDVAVGIPQKEQQWMDLIQNENIKLHLGWHGLVNKVSNQASATASEVDKNEAAFFSHDRFSGLPASILGLAALKPRINTIVHTTLLDALPDLKDQFKMKLEKALKDLKGLGHSRSNANARKTFMILMSNDFTAKATSAVFGHYNSPWFEQESMRGSQKVIKTLRSEIHRLHDDFALGMRLHGATYRIEGSTTINIAAATFSGEDTPHSYDWADKGKDLTDKDAVDWVLQELPKFRGSELSGEVNSDLVDRLFRDRSENWQVLSEEHVSTVFSRCMDFLECLLLSAVAKMPATCLTESCAGISIPSCSKQETKLDSNWTSCPRMRNPAERRTILFMSSCFSKPVKGGNWPPSTNPTKVPD